MDTLCRKSSQATSRSTAFPPMAICLIALLAASLLWLTSAQAAEKSAVIAARLDREQQELTDAREELGRLTLTITDQDRLIEENRAQLADATTRLSEAEDRYSESLNRFSDRITEIYKMGDSEYYAVILTSEDFTDAVTRFDYLGIITENDRKLVDRLKAEETTVRALRDRVDGLKQESMVDIRDLKRRQIQLQEEIAASTAAVQKDTAGLEQARQDEAREEALRFAQNSLLLDSDFSFSTAMMGPTALVGPDPPAGLRASGVVLNGQASWYGPGFHGNTTANGEIYNQAALTAAHKSLPFGTWLKVSYNGRSVFVRINDRGPYIPGRFLDLSAGSAQAIGLTGVGYVQAEIYR